ncbi:heparan-alpha-glucosaminide N-acetyltransferase domain-containing protein [Rhodococcus sp. X156]|uniref:heparan-alpha-glucosaminide N-acetyltransferase domain-containing protein n=1 Tax=Rhodococcus sp. X156 TaxID=2499145 RepID=UPI000FDA1C23|nr:heparan-alpha-glucosaminide N-acetyltransferase domain-containing protein [Rhodococcus sp. X156]
MTAALRTGATPTTALRPSPAPRPSPVPRTAGPGAVGQLPRARLNGIDAARGIALVGMMAIHALPDFDPDTGAPTWSFLVFGGRSAALFAVLAGVSVAFMTGRARVRRGAAVPTAVGLLARAGVIGCIGLLLGYADPSLAMVILPYYAMMFVLVAPLVLLPTWAVAGAGVVAAVGGPALTHVLLPHLPAPSLDNPGFGDLVQGPGQLLAEVTLVGEYPALPWMAYLCAGLVLGRLSLGRAKVALVTLVSGLVLAVAAAVTSSLLLHTYGGVDRIRAAVDASNLTTSETEDVLVFGGDGTTPTSTWWWLALDKPHTSTPLDLAATTGVALAVIGVLLLVGHLAWPPVRRVLGAVQAPLVAAGTMTLTLYTVHLMFINSAHDTYPAMTSYLLQVVAVLALGLAWRSIAGRGPLETLATGAATRARRRVLAVASAPPSRRSGGRHRQRARHRWAPR